MNYNNNNNNARQIPFVATSGVQRHQVARNNNGDIGRLSARLEQAEATIRQLVEEIVTLKTSKSPGYVQEKNLVLTVSKQNPF